MSVMLVRCKEQMSAASVLLATITGVAGLQEQREGRTPASASQFYEER
jgi:hypothetical protein